MPEHEKWLLIAQEDILAAKKLVRPKLFTAAAYHCQQSAEKSLKAYLVLKKHPVIKTHDLVKLLELCMAFDQTFQKNLDAANYLNPFSTKFRYPTEFDIPDHAETKLAIKYAQSILKFVTKAIEKSKLGQTSIL
jgi:HEPN domain-containing protein